MSNSDDLLKGMMFHPGPLASFHIGVLKHAIDVLRAHGMSEDRVADMIGIFWFATKQTCELSKVAMYMAQGDKHKAVELYDEFKSDTTLIHEHVQNLEERTHGRPSRPGGEPDKPKHDDEGTPQGPSEIPEGN